MTSCRPRSSARQPVFRQVDGSLAFVVSERLGHRDVSVTLNVYAHVLKNHQRTAVDRMCALLHGVG